MKGGKDAEDFWAFFFFLSLNDFEGEKIKKKVIDKFIPRRFKSPWITENDTMKEMCDSFVTDRITNS